MANENGKTKYYALMEELKQAILSGQIKPGEKLPSENELSARYQISRHTVRKALSILINEGYIEQTWQGNILFSENGTFEELKKCGSCDDLYLRLYFSASDSRDG